MIKKSLVIFLMLLMIFQGPGFENLVIAQTTEERKTEEKQIPPEPGAGTEIYVPGFTPFLWVNHGADPYFLCPNRGALVAGLANLGENKVTSDLKEQGFTEAQAQYIWNELIKADSPDSKVTETVLTLDTPLERMRFGHGVVRMVVVKGQAELAWQLVLPSGLGSEVIYLPKPCCNLSVSLFKAQTETNTLVIKTEVKERERIVTVPEYRDRIVYRDREILKTTTSPPKDTTEVKKSRWWIIPVVGLIAAAVGGGLAARGGGSKRGGGKRDPGGCGQPGFPACP